MEITLFYELMTQFFTKDCDILTIYASKLILERFN
jgi:hypothetical protein